MEGNHPNPQPQGELNGTKPAAAPAKKSFLSGKLPIIIAIVGGLGCLGVIVLIVIGVVAYKYFSTDKEYTSDTEEITDVWGAEEYETFPEIAEGEYVWRGTIAGKDVYCNIYVNDWGTVHGAYCYGTTDSDNMMVLDGAYDNETNMLTINEYYDGNITGQWNLKYNGQDELEGDMTNYKGKTYPVKLRIF
ncbi:MAG: hypothetical protein K2F70_07820 [Muribaculaceae bacterium]|nr:hypothetical protein [Muribaculaceae bacterium]